jgi:hypothetical protein
MQNRLLNRTRDVDTAAIARRQSVHGVSGAMRNMPQCLGAFVTILVVYAALFSTNALLWLICAMVLPVALLSAGGMKCYPVLLWVIGMYWIQIAADLLGADIRGVALDQDTFGAYQSKAINLSLGALLAMTAGINLGMRARFRIRHPGDNRVDLETVGVNHGALVYAVAAFGAEVLSRAGDALPSIRQPLLGFTLLKYVCLYLLAAAVFEQRRGYVCLAAAVMFEVAIGLSGFIASYHAAFIVILIAAISHASQRMTFRQIAIFAGAFGSLLWISIIWTAIKPDYRAWVNGGTNAQIVIRPFRDRLAWIIHAVASGQIDYANGAAGLIERIGYTQFYARTLLRLDQGLIPDDLNLWPSAILHVLTPRVLFPNKGALDDTAVTTLLTGVTFGEDTSVSAGFVSEAHADFGFPLMLPPILAVGAMLGAAAKYFMTRPAPLIVREGFTTASLFLAFSYAHNIDKELGAFVTGFIALSLSLKFGHPRIAKWLCCE